MVELLEFCIVSYGVSIFVFDNLLQGIGEASRGLSKEAIAEECKYLNCASLLGVTWRVNKTSLICIGVGLAHAFLPMDALNTMIFGEFDE